MTTILDPTSNSFCEMNTRKFHQPNWEYQETLALIEAKWEEFIMWLDVVDPRDHFKIVTNKWKKIVNMVNTSQHLPLAKNSSTCKDKWGPIYGDFKQTFNYTLGHATTQNIGNSFHKKRLHWMSLNILASSCISW